MINKLRRKLAKIIAPKPVKRVKKAKTITYDYETDPKYIGRKIIENIMKDTSYRKYKLNKEVTFVGKE